MSSDDWAAVSALSTLIGSLVVTITVILALIQLKEMATARTLEAFSKIVDILTSEEMSKARRYLMKNTLPTPGKKISPKIYEQMHRVWVAFDNLGIMVAYKMLPERLALEMFYSSVIVCWEILKPHILHERESRKARYQIYFENLYERSVKYRKKYHPEESKAEVKS